MAGPNMSTAESSDDLFALGYAGLGNKLCVGLVKIRHLDDRWRKEGWGDIKQGEDGCAITPRAIFDVLAVLPSRKHMRNQCLRRVF
jgi:hypothetical protein